MNITPSSNQPIDIFSYVDPYQQRLNQILSKIPQEFWQQSPEPSPKQILDVFIIDKEFEDAIFLGKHFLNNNDLIKTFTIGSKLCIYFLIAYSNMQISNFAEAEKYAVEGMDLAFKSPDCSLSNKLSMSWLYYGDILKKQKKFDNMAANAKDQLKTQKNPEIRENLYLVLFEASLYLGDYDEAARTLFSGVSTGEIKATDQFRIIFEDFLENSDDKLKLEAVDYFLQEKLPIEIQVKLLFLKSRLECKLNKTSFDCVRIINKIIKLSDSLKNSNKKEVKSSFLFLRNFSFFRTVFNNQMEFIGLDEFNCKYPKLWKKLNLSFKTNKIYRLAIDDKALEFLEEVAKLYEEILPHVKTNAKEQIAQYIKDIQNLKQEMSVNA